MNALSKSLSELQYRIPIQVLQLAFRDDLMNYRRAPIGLDEQILLKVVRPRVLMDIDIVGGQVVIIPLENIQPRYIDTYTMVYQIPKETTQYRSIMSVLSVGYMPYASAYNSMAGGIGVTKPCQMSDTLSAAQRVADSFGNIPLVSNASAEVIGENVILVRDQARITNSYQLRCVIGNEDNLNNLQPRLYHIFSKAVELAVKSYIYNTLLIKIDQAYLTGGQELGAVKEVVLGYSDAEQMYEDYIREIVQKAFFFNNNNLAHQRFIRLQISPAL